MNIVLLLHEQAEVRGDQPAIIDLSTGSKRVLTFAELRRDSLRMAGLLWNSGLRPGHSVLLLQPMSLELYVVLSALFQLGLVAIFLDPSAGRPHIESCCSLKPPDAFIGSPRAHCLRFICPSLRRVKWQFSTGSPILGSRSLRSATNESVSSPAQPPIEDSPALIRFTSGSTGHPKASVRTHAFLLAQHRVLAKSLRLEAGERDLTTMPVFLLANLASGLTSIIPKARLNAPGRIDAKSFLRQIRTERPNRMGASPALLEALANYCSETSQHVDSLKKIFTGGGPVFPRVLDQANRMAPQGNITAVYGSTEAEPIAQVDRREISRDDRTLMETGRGLLVGLPDEAIRLELLDQETRTTNGNLTQAEFAASCRKRCQPGEIVVTGPHVHTGNLQEAREKETKLRIDGQLWHRTGDAGYVDAQGRLWLLGRCTARISDEHGTVYPFQVECTVDGFPNVRRAALVQRDGKRVLMVEAKRHVDAESLKNRLSWAQITDVVVRSKIPVDARHNAKIDYAKLVKEL